MFHQLQDVPALNGAAHRYPKHVKRESSAWYTNCTTLRNFFKLMNSQKICLSACRDGQLAHDDCERKLTFTKVGCLAECSEYYHISRLTHSSHFKCFMDATAAKPNITWTELRDALKWVGSVTLICPFVTDGIHQRTHLGDSDEIRRNIPAGLEFKRWIPRTLDTRTKGEWSELEPRRSLRLFGVSILLAPA